MIPKFICFSCNNKSQGCRYDYESPISKTKGKIKETVLYIYLIRNKLEFDGSSSFNDTRGIRKNSHSFYQACQYTFYLLGCQLHSQTSNFINIEGHPKSVKETGRRLIETHNR